MHKHVTYEQYKNIPYFEFQLLVEDWLEEIEEEKRRQKRQKVEDDRQAAKYASMAKARQPSFPKIK